MSAAPSSQWGAALACVSGMFLLRYSRTPCAPHGKVPALGAFQSSVSGHCLATPSQALHGLLNERSIPECCVVKRYQKMQWSLRAGRQLLP